MVFIGCKIDMLRVKVRHYVGCSKQKCRYCDWSINQEVLLTRQSSSSLLWDACRAYDATGLLLSFRDICCNIQVGNMLWTG